MALIEVLCLSYLIRVFFISIRGYFNVFKRVLLLGKFCLGSFGGL